MASLLDQLASRFCWLLADVSLKATLILAIAWAIVTIMHARQCSAAARYMVWKLAVYSVLILPLLTAALPAWSIPVVWRTPATSLLSLENPSFVPESSQGLLASTDITAGSVESATVGEPNAVKLVATELQAADTVAAARSGGRMSLSIGTWTFVAWFSAACFAFFPAAVGCVSLWRLRRKSRLVSGGHLLAALRQAAEQLGVNPSMRLVLSRERAMPMTWGVWWPTILLPREALRWSEARLRVVLLHETAHIARGDCFTQILATTARAVYWFNP